MNKKNNSLENIPRSNLSCKNCKNKYVSGIWLAPQFPDEKVLLFCCEKCKQDYLEAKLSRIKQEYPRYYKNIMKNLKEKDFPSKPGDLWDNKTRINGVWVNDGDL